MIVDKGWKPGASDRERSNREHGVWVSRPYGLRARENRAREARAWRAEVAEDDRRFDAFLADPRSPRVEVTA